MNETEMIITLLVIPISIGTTIGAYLGNRNYLMLLMIQILHIFLGILIGMSIN
jgi:hypothetical protein